MPHRYLRDPKRLLQEAQVPLDPEHIKVFQDRLLGSSEIFSTFGLANSLAGFLVGPLVLALAMVLQNLASREGKGSRLTVIAMAAPPLLCLLFCLVLTKSRSAYIGLFCATAVLAWQARRRAPSRLLIGAGVASLVVISTLVAAGLAAGKLDREVVTQSSMSMR